MLRNNRNLRPPEDCYRPPFILSNTRYFEASYNCSEQSISFPMSLGDLVSNMA